MSEAKCLTQNVTQTTHTVHLPAVKVDAGKFIIRGQDRKNVKPKLNKPTLVLNLVWILVDLIK